ncbi:DUF418 domain-containing protein [Streptomyces sp. NPDC058417]|uniref:DUF418 domain-containing protein n=1 Tax=unclassified Streptomyces TaxID=2593676 RepID=UPI0036666C1F
MLRGLALLGILLVNARSLSGTELLPAVGTVDYAAAVLTGLTAEMKFYPLLAFLFGVSTVLALRLPASGRRSANARYLRRLGALFLLGAAHFTLLYGGDILTTYAVLGLVAYALRNRSARVLRGLGLGLLALFTLFLTASALWIAHVVGPTAHPVSPTRAEIARYSGGPAETLAAKAALLPGYLEGSVLFAPHVLAFILLGMAAGKAGLFERERTPARLRRLAVAGLAVGVPGSAVMTVCFYGPVGWEWMYLGRAIGAVTGPALTCAYVCLTLLVTDAGRHRRAIALLAAAGRTTLTHYLGQSLVLCLVFTGYGLGLYGSVGGAGLIACCVALFVAQVLVTDKYLRGGRGPAEAFVRVLAGRRATSG